MATFQIKVIPRQMMIMHLMTLNLKMVMIMMLLLWMNHKRIKLGNTSGDFTDSPNYVINDYSMMSV